VTKANYDEIFEMYKWARLRNLYVTVGPPMVSGRCADSADWKKITPSKEKLVELYTKIYGFNIEKDIQTMQQIREEGVSPYAGGKPCNQIACGMYVTLTGTVLRCPGDDVTTFGSIWDSSIGDIWKKSENFERAGTYNCRCPPKDGKTIPDGFYEKVLEKVERMQKK
jgi:MoaA/NifB/PqqE/SkfB family radical SAM enzyme